MRRPSVTRPVEPDVTAILDQKIDWLLRCYGINAAGNKVIDLFATAPPYELSFAGFKNAFAYMWDYRMIGGRNKRVQAVDEWLANQPIQIVGCAMRPDKGFPLYFDEDGGRFKNTWCTFVWDPVSMFRVRPFLVYIRKLIPDPMECGYFLDMIAHRLRKPEIPGPSCVMVAVDATRKRELQGTGRGTLSVILQKLFGHRYVKNIPFETFASLNSQTQFSASWQANSLLVIVDEAKAVDPGTNTFSGRRGIYENIKGLVDPRARRVMLTDKRIPYFDSWVFAAYLVFSNHRDALQFPTDGERRFFVLENGALPTDAERAVINKWLDDDDNIAALHQWLGRRNLAAFDPYRTPPETRAKAHMQRVSATDMDAAFDLAEQYMPGIAFHIAQLRTWVSFFLEDQSLMRTMAFTIVRKQRTEAVMAPPDFKKQRQVRMKGRLDYPKPLMAFSANSMKAGGLDLAGLKDMVRRNDKAPSATPVLRTILGGKGGQNDPKAPPAGDETYEDEY